MTSFILNNTLIKTDVPKGMSLLNFIRNEAGLKGTKSGCKEGDCGACTVLSGEVKNGEMVYKTIVSCLTPLGNIEGKHIVTIEGLNQKSLTPVQHEIVEHAATQCGFCTPGFIVSLTGYALSKEAGSEKEAIASVAGNICRCTGYKSIEKAALSLAALLKNRDQKDPFNWLVEHQFIPEYFTGIKERLEKIKRHSSSVSKAEIAVGGGTDLMVREADTVKVSALNLLSLDPALKEIKRSGNKLILGGSVTVNELLDHEDFKHAFPKARSWFKLISSEQIRNTATIAGNFVNASPIGDMSIFFLALETELVLSDGTNKRKIPLSHFFLDYKKLDIRENELVLSVEFELPDEKTLFNFEKVSKRLHLDIASVNTAIKLETEGKKIKKAVLAAGGIAPIPKVLSTTSGFLTGKELSMETVKTAAGLLSADISPISDVRGSKEYKELLLKQLFLAHFMETAPEIFQEEAILQYH
jgi:xanthine dehydrogenase small subunit